MLLFGLWASARVSLMEIALLAKALVSLRPFVGRLANDDVIEHFDLEELPASNEVAGYSDVGFARRWVAGRMVVHQHEGRSIGNNGHLENFPGVNQQRVECSRRNDLPPDNASPRI